MIPKTAGFVELIAELHKAHTIALVGHKNPDGDALGAVFALYHYLKRLGKNPIPLSINKVGKVYHCIPGVDLAYSQVDFENVDLIVALDCGCPERLEFYDTKYDYKTINIDHHYTCPNFAKLNRIDKESSSVSEILTKMFIESDIEIDSNMANALLTGIYFDTNGFQHQVSAQTLEYVGVLMESGADLDKIREHLVHEHKDTLVQLWGVILDRINLDPVKKMLVSSLYKDDYEKLKLVVEEIGLDQISNFMGTIQDGDFSLLLTEVENHLFKGSLRSEHTDRKDVSQIAIKFGGGGHRCASGFVCEREKIEDILNQI
jgi:phosphoesterase RecJ-like protein